MRKMMHLDYYPHAVDCEFRTHCSSWYAIPQRAYWEMYSLLNFVHNLVPYESILLNTVTNMTV